LKLPCCEGLQISPKAEADDLDLTSGILSKPFGIAWIIGIRLTYERGTFHVSALKGFRVDQTKIVTLLYPLSYATLAHLFNVWIQQKSGFRFG
jgi:hypothetical protein